MFSLGFYHVSLGKLMDKYKMEIYKKNVNKMEKSKIVTRPGSKSHSNSFVNYSTIVPKNTQYTHTTQ